MIECSKMLSTTTILNIILRLSIVTRSLFVPIVFQLFSNNMESSWAISILILNVVLKIFEYSNLIQNNSVVWTTWSILNLQLKYQTYIRACLQFWVTSDEQKTKKVVWVWESWSKLHNMCCTNRMMHKIPNSTSATLLSIATEES